MSTESQILLNLAVRTHNLLRNCHVPGKLASEAADIMVKCREIHETLDKQVAKEENEQKEDAKTRRPKAPRK